MPEVNVTGTGTGGMNGYHDIVVALQWVKTYISFFGGNQNEVRAHLCKEATPSARVPPKMACGMRAFFRPMLGRYNTSRFGAVRLQSWDGGISENGMAQPLVIVKSRALDAGRLVRWSSCAPIASPTHSLLSKLEFLFVSQ